MRFSAPIHYITQTSERFRVDSLHDCVQPNHYVLESSVLYVSCGFMQLYPVKRRYNYESFIQIGLVVSIIVSKSVLLWIDYVIYLYISKCGATN